MAGSLATIASEHENSVVAIRDQWKIRFARFFYYPSLSSTCPNIKPRLRYPKTRFKGTWISTLSSTASLQLLADHSTSDVILTICFEGRILEEHFVSKLNFTWPQVTCVSGIPPRGSSAVFVSYKDSVDKIQKFALKFSTIYEIEAFINALKDIVEYAKDIGHPSYNIESEISCQFESRSPYRPSSDFEDMAHFETSTDMPSFSSYEVGQQCNAEETSSSLGHKIDGQDSHFQKSALCNNFEDIVTDFPPSFTSLLTNCCSEISKEQPTVSEKVDLKSQIMKYMEDSSFQDILIKVEKVINELGDDFIM